MKPTNLSISKKLAIFGMLVAFGFLIGPAPSIASALNETTNLTWLNPSSGVISSWLIDGSGHVLGKQDLDWQCKSIDGCSTQWRPIDVADVNDDGHNDLTWLNPSSGVISSWLIDGSGHVLGKQDLDWQCKSSDGCSTQWRPISIVNVSH